MFQPIQHGSQRTPQGCRGGLCLLPWSLEAVQSSSSSQGGDCCPQGPEGASHQSRLGAVWTKEVRVRGRGDQQGTLALVALLMSRLTWMLGSLTCWLESNEKLMLQTLRPSPHVPEAAKGMGS